MGATALPGWSHQAIDAGVLALRGQSVPAAERPHLEAFRIHHGWTGRRFAELAKAAPEVLPAEAFATLIEARMHLDLIDWLSCEGWG